MFFLKSLRAVKKNGSVIAFIHRCVITHSCFLSLKMFFWAFGELGEIDVSLGLVLYHKFAGEN